MLHTSSMSVIAVIDVYGTCVAADLSSHTPCLMPLQVGRILKQQTESTRMCSSMKERVTKQVVHSLYEQHERKLKHWTWHATCQTYPIPIL